ncbi:MAG: hypothetical protein V2A79_06095 [Planctomycetota bacterium]
MVRKRGSYIAGRSAGVNPTARRAGMVRERGPYIAGRSAGVNPAARHGGLTAAEFGQGAVELAVEHGLITNQLHEVGLGGERVDEGAAGLAEAVVALGGRDGGLEALDLGVGLLDGLLLNFEQGVLEGGTGEASLSEVVEERSAGVGLASFQGGPRSAGSVERQSHFEAGGRLGRLVGRKEAVEGESFEGGEEGKEEVPLGKVEGGLQGLDQAALFGSVGGGAVQHPAQVGGGLDVGVVVGAAAFIEGLADGTDLVALGAAEPPVAGGDAFDQGFFDDAVRLEFGAEVGEEGVEVGAALGAVARVNDDLAGEEAVFERVAARPGLALGGPGSGGALGIGTVGEALFRRDGLGHRGPP